MLVVSFSFVCWFSQIWWCPPSWAWLSSWDVVRVFGLFPFSFELMFLPTWADASSLSSWNLVSLNSMAYLLGFDVSSPWIRCFISLDSKLLLFLFDISFLLTWCTPSLSSRCTIYYELVVPFSSADVTSLSGWRLDCADETLSPLVRSLGRQTVLPFLIGAV